MDYCDVIYHMPTYDDFYSNYHSERARTDPVNINLYFAHKIEAIQYDAVLATRFSFYKNILYKNIEDEMGQKVKNILRICSS